MKQNMSKLFNWQALLSAVRSAAQGLLPFANVGALDEPKDHVAKLVRRSVLLAAGAVRDIPYAGGRFAFAAVAAGGPPRSEASAMEQLFPHVLAYRKEEPGLHAASPESKGLGAAPTENLHAPHARKSIGPQTDPVQEQPMDADRIAMLRKHTLEGFDDLDSYAEEMGHEPLSDAAKASAWNLARRILDEYPAYYNVCPEHKGSVSIGFAKRKKHYCTILCKADGSITCFVALDGNTSLKRYASIEGLPDDYMREALAPQPEAASR